MSFPAVAEIVRQIRVYDILDILLVAFILYRVFLLIKGTRAVQMLIGLGVLLFASLLSQWWELYAVDWLIQSFWSQIVLAIIILFQPELRRALALMGETPFFATLTPMESSRSLEEIVRATVSLANKKIGALIAIERETDLRNYIEMGTELNARITKELLTTVFLPFSPIHDGAVIIRGNRVSAAGCFLPLTLSQVPKTLGTRHRAAIGLTEETDAVVIVVSEETGTVSLAVAGKLQRDLDIAGLRNELTRLLLPHRSPRRRWWPRRSV